MSTSTGEERESTPPSRPTLSHPAHWIATGLGSGLLRPGPGTWGTALAWVLFVVIAPHGAPDLATGLLVVAVALMLGS